MRMLLLLLVCGCGTTDPGLWKTCSGCANAGTWELIADGAEIRGDYDPVGPPDPYLCVTVLGHSHCTSNQSDTSSPRWSQTLATSLATSDLTAAPLAVALWDADTGGLDSDDLICSTSVAITAADLEAGGIRFDCSTANAAFLFQHAD